MKDPVIAADGQTYEREVIQRWLRTTPAYSPVTGQLLEHTHLLPNLAVRALLEAQ